ncbi:hypothetical protein WJX74_010675 [Apatococcus lobatus]
METAQLILDMLYDYPDEAAVSEAVLRHGLNKLIKCAREDDSLDQGMQLICLRILLTLIEQPALHSRLPPTSICELLLDALGRFLHSFPSDRSPKIVERILRLLCADGPSSKLRHEAGIWLAATPAITLRALKASPHKILQKAGDLIYDVVESGIHSPKPPPSALNTEAVRLATRPQATISPREDVPMGHAEGATAGHLLHNRKRKRARLCQSTPSGDAAEGNLAGPSSQMNGADADGVQAPDASHSPASIIDEHIMALWEMLSGSELRASMFSAQEILHLLEGSDKHIASEAIIRTQMLGVILKNASAESSLKPGMQNICLQILLDLVKQPALHSRLLDSGICKTLSDACKGFLRSMPQDFTSPALVAAALRRLVAQGASSEIKHATEERLADSSAEMVSALTACPRASLRAVGRLIGNSPAWLSRHPTTS